MGIPLFPFLTVMLSWLSMFYAAGKCPGGLGRYSIGVI